MSNQQKLPWHARLLERIVGKVETWRQWPIEDDQKLNTCACQRDCTLGCDE